MTYNEVIILGRLGQDPELKYSASGQPYARFSVATSRKSGSEEKTTWFKVTAFGKSAEFVGEYLKKGAQVFVRGSIETGSYEKEGQTVYTWNVIAHNVISCGRREDDGSKPGQGLPQAARPATPQQVLDDDIPF